MSLRKGQLVWPVSMNGNQVMAAPKCRIMGEPGSGRDYWAAGEYYPLLPVHVPKPKMIYRREHEIFTLKKDMLEFVRHAVGR